MKNHNSKLKNLKMAVDFHGHLGPYLVLGMCMGDLAIKKLACRRHFGIMAEVYGAAKKPKSCLIDGIQVSAGCTYGKGNIHKQNGKIIRVVFKNLVSKRKLRISLKKELIQQLDSLKGHHDSEVFAKKIANTEYSKLFEIKF